MDKKILENHIRTIYEAKENGGIMDVKAEAKQIIEICREMEHKFVHNNMTLADKNNLPNGYYWVSCQGMEPVILQKDEYGWNSMGIETDVDMFYYEVISPVSSLKSDEINILRKQIFDIKHQSTRFKGAASDKHLLITDLEIIEDKANSALNIINPDSNEKS